MRASLPKSSTTSPLISKMRNSCGAMGLLKLLYPHGEFDREAVRACLEYALETRRRIKEQLKKIGGMEFYDVGFSYRDRATLEETFVSVPEQGGATLVPEGHSAPPISNQLLRRTR